MYDGFVEYLLTYNKWKYNPINKKKSSKYVYESNFYFKF